MEPWGRMDQRRQGFHTGYLAKNSHRKECCDGDLEFLSSINEALYGNIPSLLVLGFLLLPD